MLNQQVANVFADLSTPLVFDACLRVGVSIRTRPPGTRSLIMEAVDSLVAEGRIHSFSVQDVADRAGILYASVYRHFPPREALLEAMYEWGNELVRSQMPSTPRTLDEIPAWVEKSIPMFEQHAAINQAIMVAQAGLNISPESRRREEAFAKVVAEGAPYLPPGDARRAAAVVRCLVGSRGWATLRQRFELDAADTAAALTWALQVLIRYLKQHEADASPGRQEKETQT